MKISLKVMSDGQLTALIARAKRRQAELEKETIAEVRKKIQAMIESEGLTRNEVLGESRKSRRAHVASARRQSRKH